MPKAGFYAVKRGRQPGVYPTWEECKAQTDHFPNAVFKSFKTLREAELFVGVVPVETAASRAAAEAVAQAPATINAASGSAATSSVRKASTKVATPKIKEKGKENLAVSDETKYTVVYTDGACRGNGKASSIAGIGVWYGPDDPRNLAERCPGGQTNNRAELIAIIRCLETEEDPSQPLLIKTDSQYSINCIDKWFPGWIAKGWKGTNGQPVKNKEVIQHLARLLDERPGRVMLQYVKGHAGIEGNEGADALAGRGSMQPAKADRRWNTGDIDKVIEERLSQSPGNEGAPLRDVSVDFDIDESMLLTQEELEEMERSQVFD